MKYAYHGTNPVNLPSISFRGLAPFEASRGSGVWFVRSRAGAAKYGRAVIRFPWPPDAVYSGIVGAGGPSHWVRRYVEPDDDLMVSIDGGPWRRVTSYYDPDYADEAASTRRCWGPGQTYAVYGSELQGTPGPASDGWLAPCAGRYVRQLQYRGEVTLPMRPGVRWTKLEELSGVRAIAWCPPRLPRLYDAFRRDLKLPPIRIVVRPEGNLVLADGNHRLAAARDLGVQQILVDWVFG